jgi:beta-galactosidase
MLFYAALRGLGVDVDIRHPDTDLSDYQLIVAPALQLIDEQRARHLMTYAGTARMVFGPRSGFRDLNGKVHPGGQPGQLEPLLGCRLLNVDAMPPLVSVSAGGHPVETWAESYRVTQGRSVVAYDDGPLIGQAAVVRHQQATTIGAWSQALITEVLAQELRAIGLEPILLPDGIRRVSTGERTIWLNFTETIQRTPSGLTLEPVSWRIERKD